MPEGPEIRRAVDQLAAALALGPHGITINAVLPGTIETDINREMLAQAGVTEAIEAQLRHKFGAKGERIVVFVVLKAGVQTGGGLRGSLRDHVREDLGPIATPSEIIYRDSLTKTRSGKIMRRLLKAEGMGEDPGDTSTLAD